MADTAVPPDTASSNSAPAAQTTKGAKVHGSGAHWVAAGIFLSRISGLVRQRVFAHFFGNSDAGDAFYSALKIPNFLQNLFGEGVLSASFIPVYASLLARGKDEEATEVAETVAALLGLFTTVLVAIGVLTTPFLIDLIAPGFQGEKRALTIHLVQILFPGTGLLVMSAWCLGVLNSHRKFFLSYVAPVIWNAAIIFALIFWGGREEQNNLAVYTAWGVVAGSLLQFGVQLPVVLKVLSRFKPKISFALESVRTVLHNFVPVLVARGVVQVSAYIDNLLASFLPMGAVSALAYAQSIYLLPISLFGMSISAAELPAMSSAQGNTEEIAEYLNRRLNSGLQQLAFLVVPCVAMFLILGDLVIGALYQSGEFRRDTTIYVWGVLAGSTVGMLATTFGRLYSSTYYSLKDTRTPLRFAIIRVLLTTGLGYLVGLRLPGWLGLDAAWGTAGLTSSAGIAGWVEFYLLRRSLIPRIGWTGVKSSRLAKLWGAALVAGGLAYGVKLVIGHHHPIITGGIVLSVYGIAYVAFTYAMKIEQCHGLLKRVIVRR
jgi:putative peptidoglycan lipid II flippase